jgi:hypothetical protein
LRLRRLYAMSPVGVVGGFFVGLANGAFGGLGAAFATEIEACRSPASLCS